MQPNESLWRVVAFTALFWLLRNVVVPGTKYACLLVFGCIYLLASPFILLAYMWGEETRQRYETPVEPEPVTA